MYKILSMMGQLRESMNFHSKEAKRAFSLTELLIVIAIFAVLISLLSPVLSRSIKTAMNINCTNNLKIMTVAAITYEYDHGALMMAMGDNNARLGRIASLTPDQSNIQWAYFAQEYLGASKGEEYPGYSSKSETLKAVISLMYFGSDVLHCPFRPLPEASDFLKKHYNCKTQSDTGMHYAYYSGSATNMKMTTEKYQSLLNQFESDTGYAIGGSPALFGDISNTDTGNNLSFQFTSHKLPGAPVIASSWAQAEAFLDDGNVSHVDGSVKSYSAAPVSQHTWAQDSWCYSQSGAVSIPTINPITAIYPHTNNEGAMDSFGFVFGPFHKVYP